ncbi:hypothetical protein SUGI_0732230 [Cryptomeria japonica]|uniref:mitochondrial intermembrane space import and assembly protein 40 homolog n=1 Tax=Cryptomeria japonica TaxID=3369 RepID=UPI0024149551|nr:mitochondrial intermembrane space import and assembly protein 40 homolog [Cryptomeria japonica]GLJ36460.1 hypothetical protein SUGI_0732230 [Cryptomeria japonica]
MDNVNNKSSLPTSMDALVAEATAKGNDKENESLEVIAQEALECPCLADLRDGPCGGTFSESFKCYIKSSAAEKGSDCVKEFIALQECIEANQDMFAKYYVDDKDSTDGHNSQQEEKTSSS